MKFSLIVLASAAFGAACFTSARKWDRLTLGALLGLFGFFFMLSILSLGFGAATPVPPGCTAVIIRTNWANWPLAERQKQ